MYVYFEQDGGAGVYINTDHVVSIEKCDIDDHLVYVTMVNRENFSVESDLDSVFRKIVRGQ